MNRQMGHILQGVAFMSLVILMVNCDSDAAASGAAEDKNDPHYIEDKLEKINKKTDQVKGFIQDIPKFLDSIKAIQEAEKEIADKLASDEEKAKAVAGNHKRKRSIQGNGANNHVEEITKDELVSHSIDYINNTLPEVKSKLVDILETFLKPNITETTTKTSHHPFENDSDYIFPSIVPQSTLSATLLKYNISLQNEKRELLKLENVILKMQSIVESALLEIYRLEDTLQDDTALDAQ